MIKAEWRFNCQAAGLIELTETHPHCQRDGEVAAGGEAKNLSR